MGGGFARAHSPKLHISKGDHTDGLVVWIHGEITNPLTVWVEVRDTPPNKLKEHKALTFYKSRRVRDFEWKTVKNEE